MLEARARAGGVDVGVHLPSNGSNLAVEGDGPGLNAEPTPVGTFQSVS